MLDEFKYRDKLILSGGLNSRNIREALDIAKPFAVDLASGLEKTPGIKDLTKIKEFFYVLNSLPSEKLKEKSPL